MADEKCTCEFSPKRKLVNNMKVQKGFLVVLLGQIMEISLDRNLSWLRMFCALPRELVEKHPKFLDIRRVLDSEQYRALLKGDSFLKLV